MGGMGFNQEIGRNSLLVAIFDGKYECAIRLTGMDKETGKSKTGEYKLYEQFNEEEIINYAKETSEKSNVKISKIEVLTLKSPIKEILL